MKRFIISLAFAAFISPAFAQIPVTVTTQVSDSPMTFAEFAENATRWKQQYDQMKGQIDQAKKQYEALSGSRGLGTIMNNPALRDYLPSDWQAVYDSVNKGGYSGLSGRAQSIYSSNQAFDACANVTPADARTSCEARAVKPSQDQAFALNAYDAAKSRIDQIDQLMREINNTQDPKAIQELQARIAAEQANIQNEQTKLQMFAMVAAAEEKAQEQRRREIQARTWSSRGGIKAQPLQFNGN